MKTVYCYPKPFYCNGISTALHRQWMVAPRIFQPAFPTDSVMVILDLPTTNLPKNLSALLMYCQGDPLEIRCHQKLCFGDTFSRVPWKKRFKRSLIDFPDLYECTALEMSGLPELAGKPDRNTNPTRFKIYRVFRLLDSKHSRKEFELSSGSLF